MKQSELDQKYEVRKMGVKDVEEMTNFLLKYFVPHNPITQIFREPESANDRKLLGGWCHKIVQHNATFACYEKKSGVMVAIRVASIHDVDNSFLDEWRVTSADETAAYRFSKWIHRDLLKKLNANKIMLKQISLVIPDHLGNGLAMHLDRYSNAFAMKTGCQFMVAVAASHYAIRLNQKLGSKVLREVKYADYVDPETGVKPDLDLSPLHTGVRVTYQEVKIVPKNKL